MGFIFAGVVGIMVAKVRKFAGRRTSAGNVSCLPTRLFPDEGKGVSGMVMLVHSSLLSGLIKVR